MASHISSLASGGHSSNALERSLTLTAAAAEQIISETIKHEEDLLPKEVYDDQAYKELAKDEVVDRKLKLSDAPSGRLEELKRQHSMQFDKTMNLNRRQKLWMLLDDPSFSSASFYYANFSMLIILISTISFCLESEFNCQNVDLHTHLLNYTLPNGQLACEEWEGTWWWFECLAVAFFSAELLLRWASCPYKGKFMKDFANWIDFLAVLPFYLEQVCTLSQSAHRAFGICRAPLHLCTSAPLHPWLAILRIHLEQVAGEVLSAFSVFRVIRLVRSAPRHRHTTCTCTCTCIHRCATCTWVTAPWHHGPLHRFGTLVLHQPRTSAPLHLCTSAPLHLCTYALRALCTPAPLHPYARAPIPPTPLLPPSRRCASSASSRWARASLGCSSW